MARGKAKSGPKGKGRKAAPSSRSVATGKAKLLKALAHPVRITIFEALAQGEKTVGELVELLAEKEANTSRHLAVMRAAGLLDSRKEGLQVYYSVKIPCLLAMLSCLDDGLCCLAEEQDQLWQWIRKKKVK